MKHFSNQSNGSQAGRINNGGAIIRIRSIPIDVAHVVASACRHGGADRSFQF